jgi:hypothetical protein
LPRHNAEFDAKQPSGVHQSEFGCDITGHSAIAALNNVPDESRCSVASNLSDIELGENDLFEIRPQSCSVVLPTLDCNLRECGDTPIFEVLRWRARSVKDMLFAWQERGHIDQPETLTRLPL